MYDCPHLTQQSTNIPVSVFFPAARPRIPIDHFSSLPMCFLAYKAVFFTLKAMIIVFFFPLCIVCFGLHNNTNLAWQQHNRYIVTMTYCCNVVRLHFQWLSSRGKRWCYKAKGGCTFLSSHTSSLWKKINRNWDALKHKSQRFVHKYPLSEHCRCISMATEFMKLCKDSLIQQENELIDDNNTHRFSSTVPIFGASMFRKVGCVLE